MKNIVDYHLHTYFSDGSMSPTDIVKRANQLGYAEIAITDHDGIGGVQEGKIAGDALGVKVISGIEFSTVYENQKFEDKLDLHILGYHIDINHKGLLEVLEEIRQKRTVRNQRLLKVLKDMGYEITLEDLCLQDGQDYIGKPVIARAMMRKGYISNAREAFAPGKFLEDPRAKAIKKDKITVQRTIELIKASQGIAVLAHPMKIKKLADRSSSAFYEKLDLLIGDLKGMGLKGIECYHTDQTQEESLNLVGLAEKHHLHITQGSDYHGPEMEK